MTDVDRAGENGSRQAWLEIFHLWLMFQKEYNGLSKQVRMDSVTLHLSVSRDSSVKCLTGMGTHFKRGWKNVSFSHAQLHAVLVTANTVVRTVVGRCMEFNHARVTLPRGLHS